MTCTHFWLTDSNGLGHCQRCGKTKQFKGYERPVLKLGATGKVTRRDFAIHPDFCAKSYLRAREG